MHWDDFYSRYDGWSQNTIISKIYALKDFGPPEEIIEVADAVLNLAAACRLVRKAVSFGVIFKPDHMLELDGVVDRETITFAIIKAQANGTIFSVQDILDLDGILDSEQLSEVLGRSIALGLKLNAEEILSLDGIVQQYILDAAARDNAGRLSADDLLALEGIVSQNVLLEIDRKNGSYVLADPAASRKVSSPGQKEPGKLFTAFAAFGMLADGHKKRKKALRIGDRVRVRYRGQEGVIIDINRDMYTVSIADGRTVESYDESQIERVW